MKYFIPFFISTIWALCLLYQSFTPFSIDFLVGGFSIGSGFVNVTDLSPILLSDTTFLNGLTGISLSSGNFGTALNGLPSSL